MDETTSNKPTNVAVYVDYENVHKALLKQRKNALRLGFFEKLRAWCKEQNKRVVQTTVYCNFDNSDLYQSHHQTMLQNYGVETIHTSNQGKNYADLKISIDVLTSMYLNENIDEFIIVSNDKDMTPLLNAIRANKRNAYVVTVGDEYNHTICEFADKHVTADEICRTQVEHLIIEDVEVKIWNSVKKFITYNIKKYSSLEPYSHYSLHHYIDKNTGFYNIPKYELYNIFKNFYDEKKIILYWYAYGTQKYQALIPTDEKQTCIDLHILKESDIIENLNFDEIIEQEYKKCL